MTVDIATLKMETATKAIKEAILELFPEDADVAEKSVTLGDPWEWGAEVATICTEHGLSCLDYYGDDWMDNSIKIQEYVRLHYGLKIFIECCNSAIHNVYWDDWN